MFYFITLSILPNEDAAAIALFNDMIADMSF